MQTANLYKKYNVPKIEYNRNIHKWFAIEISILPTECIYLKTRYVLDDYFAKHLKIGIYYIYIYNVYSCAELKVVNCDFFEKK